jgi:hypothetical protein
MKALSLTQPWAETILHHGKRIENRMAWKGCSYRGPILLHAAKGVGTRDAFEDTVDQILDILKPAPGAERLAMLDPVAICRIGGRGRHHAEGWFAPAPTLKRGGIIGRARIVDVTQPSALPRGVHAEVAFENWVRRGGDPSQRRWWFGGFALVLDEVEPLPFVPWKGALGLFDIPDDYASKARR